jgi:hypothetical protein
MTNAEVFAAFASRQSAEGGSVRSERTSNGVVLYSYATPIAFYEDAESFPVFTPQRFSQTTSKQQTQAKRACHGHVDALDREDFHKSAQNVGASFLLAR